MLDKHYAPQRLGDKKETHASQILDITVATILTARNCASTFARNLVPLWCALGYSAQEGTLLLRQACKRAGVQAAAQGCRLFSASHAMQKQCQTSHHTYENDRL